MTDETFYSRLLHGYPVVVVQDVVWGEMDAYQHVNNVVYFRYFENARLAFINRIGWPALEAATGVGPILASTQGRFRRALTYPDTIATGARVLSLEADRFVLEHRIVSQRLGDIATEGQGTIVSFNYSLGKKAPLPDELRERIGALEGK